MDRGGVESVVSDIRRSNGYANGPLSASSGQQGKIRQGVANRLLFNPGGSNADYLLGTSEPGVQRAMLELLKPGVTFFDIRANVGFHSTVPCRLIRREGM